MGIFLFHIAYVQSTDEAKVITHTENRQKYLCHPHLHLKMNLHQDIEYSLNSHCLVYELGQNSGLSG